MIGKSVSHYHILEKLGEGGMGVVYKAEDTKLKRTVALKFVHPNLTRDEKAKQRFIQEARAASSLDHTNICTIHEIDETENGQMFIAMGYYEGETLKDRMARAEKNGSSSLPIDEVIRIASQIAEGLARTHEAGIVHRDIKPANIVITDRGEVKILDYGLAKLAGHPQLVGGGSTLGTVAYVAPEQSESEETDERADIWALGVILYEMLTGQQPFRGEADQVILYVIVNEEPAPVRTLRPEVPEELEAIVSKALAKEPDKRYHHVEKLLTALRRCRTFLAKEDLSVDQSAAQRPTALANRRWLSVGGLILILAALFFYLLGPLAQRPRPVTKLAILPFQNLGSPDDQYFTDGMTEEIANRIGHIRNLDVIKGSGALPNGSISKGLRELGTQFEVNFVLTGGIHLRTIHVGSDSVLISPQIFRVSDSTQVWAHVYQIGLDDIFQMQSNIAEQVARALDLPLPQPQTRSVRSRPTTSLQAYDYYFRGLMHARQSTHEHELKLAFATLSKAIQLDPNFALAHAWLSITHSMMFWFHFDRSEERTALAKASADEALKLAPDLSEAYQALGHYYYRCHLDYERALTHFETALAIKPNDDHTLVGIASVKRRQGKFKEAVAYFERAVELNPQGPGLPLNTADTYLLLREYANAERYYDLAISFAPDYERLYAKKAMLNLSWYGRTAVARSILTEAPRDTAISYRPFMAMAWFLTDLIDENYEQASIRLSSESQQVLETQFFYIPKTQLYAQIYGLLKQSERERASYDSARVLLQAKLREHPNDARLHSSLGIAYAGLGQVDEAIHEGRKGVELMPVTKEAWKALHRIQDLARIYVMVNKLDAALDQIEYLLSVPGEMTTTLLRLDPTWAPLKNHPRFQKLLGEGVAVSGDVTAQ